MAGNIKDKLAAIATVEATTLKKAATVYGATTEADAFALASAIAERSATLGRLGSATIFRHTDGEKTYYAARLGAVGAKGDLLTLAVPGPDNSTRNANFARWRTVAVPEGSTEEAGKAIAVTF